MKKLAIIGCLIGLVSGCTPAAQGKVQDARDVILCSINVLEPLAEYLTSDQFFAAVQGEDVFAILEGAGVTPSEVKRIKDELKACHDSVKK